MKSLKVEYRVMGVFMRRMNIQVPERWEDLNERQFSVGARIYINAMDDVDFISEFYGLRKSVVKRMSEYEHYKLIDLVEFVKRPSSPVSFFYIHEIPGTKLLSPESRLRNVTFEHFALFDTYFFDYINKSTDDNLCRFVAALYMKKHENITEIDFEKRVAYVHKTDQMTRNAVFLNYIFIRDWLSRSFPLVFEKSDKEEDEPVKRQRPQKPNRPDWNMVLDGIVGEDILHYNDYKTMPAILAFKTINKRIKDYRKHGK